MVTLFRERGTDWRRNGQRTGLRCALAATELLTKASELLDQPGSSRLVDRWRGGWRQRRLRTLDGGLEPHAADVEIFLEAVQLQQVGQFQRADIAALRTNFLLQVADHLL